MIVLRRLFCEPVECYPAFVEMESSECESADDTDTEQLVTAHCTSAEQSGVGSTPAMAKADCLPKKCCRADETTEESAARLQSLHFLPGAMTVG